MTESASWLPKVKGIPSKRRRNAPECLPTPIYWKQSGKRCRVTLEARKPSPPARKRRQARCLPRAVRIPPERWKTRQGTIDGPSGALQERKQNRRCEAWDVPAIFRRKSDSNGRKRGVTIRTPPKKTTRLPCYGRRVLLSVGFVGQCHIFSRTASSMYSGFSASEPNLQNISGVPFVRSFLQVSVCDLHFPACRLRPVFCIAARHFRLGVRIGVITVT